MNEYVQCTPYTMSWYWTVDARSRTLLVYEGNFCVMSSTWLLGEMWNLVLTSKQVYGTEQHGSVQFMLLIFPSIFCCVRDRDIVYSDAVLCNTI